ncbi:MAG: BlaI/MecI/CopY family transcriptional regulator [Bryobacterales bacterium]|nr:BlaI/MecI/CopY family transcriptional regulator [Bryobacterales bacterium]
MAIEALSRRERQIMDVLYQHGKASAADVQKGMPDPPSYSAVRAMLRTLEEKGHIRHEADGLKFIYIPVENKDKVKRNTIRHMLRTFFSDSPEQIVAALLDVSGKKLTKEELDRMAGMIEKARKESR